MSEMELIETIIANVQRETGSGRREWTEEEDAYYRAHLVDMTLEEIAENLGRSANAVKVHRFRAGLPSHRRTPGYLTANQVGNLLRLDSHAVPCWMDKGIMPGERVPTSGKLMRRISLVRLKMWLIRPTSWLYFRVENIRNAGLRRLVELAQMRWGDEWWDTNQAAAYHGCENKDIVRYIVHGVLPAVQAPHIGGRDEAGWSRWFVRKSDALRLKVWRGKGNNHRMIWSKRADAFILRARSEGFEYQAIARMMKWPQKRVEYRAYLLKKNVSAETVNKGE